LRISHARFGNFLFPIARRRRRFERPQKFAGSRSDLVNRYQECRLVDSGRLVETAQFSDELQRGRTDLVIRHGRIEIEKGFDVSAHARYPYVG